MNSKNRNNSYIRGLERCESHIERKWSEDLINKFDTDTYLKEGVVYWKSNGNVPPKDVLEFWDYVGKDFDFEKSKNELNRQTDAFFEEYIKANKGREYSDEELFEMTCAFGEGTEVVDIITGDIIKL